MEIYVCNGKEIQGSITQYLLCNVRNNRQDIVDGDRLKDAIRNKKVDVVNLTLTSDNRLVEASKDKIAQLSGIMKAPSSIRGGVEPIDINTLDQVEKLMDEILHDCIHTYAKGASKYVEISHFNKENNTCILEFKLGLNSYVMIHYDKIIYGRVGTKPHGDHLWDREDNERDRYGICFDIGVQVVAISNKRASSKIGDGEVLKASSALGKDCVILSVESDKLNKLDYSDVDITYLKERLGKAILEHVSKQLISVCEQNPDIANNTNVSKYIEYDELKKEYTKSVVQSTGVALGVTVVIGGIIAFCLATDPEILQTGLLAKIANVGTTEQIFKAIAAYSGGLGLVFGGSTAVTTLDKTGLLDHTVDTGREVKKLRNQKRSDWMGMLGKK